MMIEHSFSSKEISKFYKKDPSTIYRLAWPHHVSRKAIAEFVENMRNREAFNTKTIDLSFPASGEDD